MYTSSTLFNTKVLQKFRIGWYLLNCIKKGHIDFDLLEGLKKLLHLSKIFVGLSLYGNGALGLYLDSLILDSDSCSLVSSKQEED